MTKRSDADLLLPLLDIAEAVHTHSNAAVADRDERLSWIAGLREMATEASPAGRRGLLRDFLVEWNEGVGPEVEAFWERVRDAGITLPRRDVVAETLARGRIANMHDYAALEDELERLQECGKVSPEEAERLAAMLDAFADDPRNRRFFEGEGAEPDELSGSAPADGELPELPAGQLAHVAPGDWRFDYFGTEWAEELQALGYQGGGPSWAAILEALVQRDAPELRGELRFDDQSDCVSVWATAPEPLVRLSRLLAGALASRETLLDAVRAAEQQVGGME